MRGGGAVAYTARMKASLLLWLALSTVLLGRPQEARTLDDLYQPGEEAVWVFELNGKRIGTHLLRYEGVAADSPEVRRLSAWVKLGGVRGMAEQLYHCELDATPRGFPLRHVMHAKFGGNVSTVETTFADGEARTLLVQRGKTRTFSTEVPADVLIQANNVIAWFEVALALHGPERDATAELAMFSSNTLRELDYGATWRGEEEGLRTLDDTLGETLKLDADGYLVELAVPAQGLVVRRTDEAMEPFSIEVPAAREPDPRFSYEEVKIRSEDALLAGSVTKPRDAEGRSPAIFFISGSGLQDRDGNSSGVEVGTRELLDHLTAAGFLCLRVDDRGAGESTGKLEGIGYQELVADAAACVRFLEGREDVDPKRIVLVGHSEGGLTAPLLAQRNPNIAGLVLMAACGRPLIEVMLDQNRDLLVESGVEGAELEAKLAEVRALLERLAGDGDVDPSELPPGQESLLENRKWLRDHAALDPVATLEQVQCPVLVLHGAKDFQVSLEQDARAIDAALERGENPDHRLLVLEDLDHLFKRVRGERSTLEEYFVKRPLAPEFLEAVTDWLNERFRAR